MTPLLLNLKNTLEWTDTFKNIPTSTSWENTKIYKHTHTHKKQQQSAQWLWTQGWAWAFWRARKSNDPAFHLNRISNNDSLWKVTQKAGGSNYLTRSEIVATGEEGRRKTSLWSYTSLWAKINWIKYTNTYLCIVLSFKLTFLYSSPQN